MGCKVSIQVHPLPLPEVKEPMVPKTVDPEELMDPVPKDPKPDEPDPEDPPDWDFDIYSSETEIRV